MKNLKSLFMLDPQVIFLNHGSFGACPRPVFQVYQDWQRRLEEQPVLFFREIYELDNQARAALGRFVHADPADLTFVTNATQGVNSVAHSLAFQPGDEILTSDHEYGACDYTWEFYCRQTGAKYIHRTIGLPLRDPLETAEAFWQGVTPRTRLIYLSHITSPTALRLPVEEICRRAREAGILTMIDGAHAPGQLDLNLDTMGADFYTGNCHKWMMAPKGAGFLYVRREAQCLIEPFTVSWGYTPIEAGSSSRFVDLFQWTGTRDPSAALTVPAAIQFMQDQGWDEVRQNCRALLRQAVERVCDLSGLPPLYTPGAEGGLQMNSAPLPPVADLPALKSRLYDEFHIEAMPVQWQDRPFIRISIQGYNTQEDVDALLNALKIVLKK